MRSTISRSRSVRRTRSSTALRFRSRPTLPSPPCPPASAPAAVSPLALSRSATPPRGRPTAPSRIRRPAPSIRTDRRPRPYLGTPPSGRPIAQSIRTRVPALDAIAARGLDRVVAERAVVGHEVPLQHEPRAAPRIDEQGLARARIEVERRTVRGIRNDALRQTVDASRPEIPVLLPAPRPCPAAASIAAMTTPIADVIHAESPLAACASRLHPHQRHLRAPASFSCPFSTPISSRKVQPTTSAPSPRTSLSRGRGRAARRQHVVHNQHPVTRLAGIPVRMQAVLPVLERVLLGHRFPRQLARLPERDEPRPDAAWPAARPG